MLKCTECGIEISLKTKKGMCRRCWKRNYIPPIITCKSCGRTRPRHAKDMCMGCYTRTYKYDKVKAYRAKKEYGIDYETFKKVRKECVVCGFSAIVHLHHLDGNKQNGSIVNLVGLCPNHHEMIHHYDYYGEIKNILKKKEFNVSKVYPTNYIDRRDEKKVI